MSSIRSFLFTFLASLALFSVIAYYATGFVTGLIFAEEEAVATPDEEDTSQNTDSNARGIVNLLLVCTDQFFYRPSPGGSVESQFNQLADAEIRNHTTTIEFLTLVSFNSITKQVMITALPGNLLVTANGQEIDLNTAYYFSQNHLYDLDSDFFVQSISALLGVQVDYTGYVDIDDYIKVVDRLGGLTVNSPEEVSEIGIIAGKQSISTGQLYQMLKKTDYQDPANKTQFLINQCRSILERITDDAHAQTAYVDFDRISQVLSTNFTKVALTEYKSLIFSYSKYEVQTPIAVGEFVEAGDDLYFQPNRSATQSLFKQYK